MPGCTVCRLQSKTVSLGAKVRAPVMDIGEVGRVAVMLDLTTYEQLLEAADEAASVRAYDVAKPVVEAELKAGEFTMLKEYRTARARR